MKKPGLLHIALFDYFSWVNAVKRSDLSPLKTQQIEVIFLYFTFSGSMCAVSEYIKIAVSWQICLSFLLSHSVNMITNPKANKISIILKSLWTKAFTGFVNSICFLTKCIFSWCLQDSYLRIIVWDNITYFWFSERSCSMSFIFISTEPCWSVQLGGSQFKGEKAVFPVSCSWLCCCSRKIVRDK